MNTANGRRDTEQGGWTMDTGQVILEATSFFITIRFFTITIIDNFLLFCLLKVILNSTSFATPFKKQVSLCLDSWKGRELVDASEKNALLLLNTFIMLVRKAKIIIFTSIDLIEPSTPGCSAGSDQKGGNAFLGYF